MTSAQTSLRLYESDTGPLNLTGFFSLRSPQQDWEDRFSNLDALYELEDNWDGEGAEALRGELIDSASDYLMILHKKDESFPPTRIAPSQDGEIIIEWQEGDLYMEVAITEPYHAEWMYQVSGQDVIQWEDKWGIKKEPDTNESYLWQEYHVA